MALDYSKIKEDFIKVIQHSQHIEEPKVDKLFELWYEAKKDFIFLMGNKLIYEFEEPVSFELSQEIKMARVENFIDECREQDLYDLGAFIEEEKETFFENKCNKDHFNKIKKGTKLIRAFKHFIQDPELLHRMQTRASMIIQEEKIEGKLCFSVHPLDFLSLSENNYNWRSCHALDGEYRAGNLSYMMDKSTIICYLKGAEDTILPRFPETVPWNNKKWRVLFYVSNDWKMVFAGRQYPFNTIEGLNMIVDKFFNSDCPYKKPNGRRVPNSEYIQNHWTHWTDYYIADFEVNGIKFNLDNEYIPVGNGITNIFDLVEDKKGSKHYNDVLHSTCYKPMYSYLVEKGWWGDQVYTLANVASQLPSSRTHFEIGGFTYCLRCGEAEVMESGSGSMMCYDCEEKYGTMENEYFCFCAECGRRIETDNAYYISDDSYCEDCFNQVGAKCDICQDYYLKEDINYNEEEDVHYCHWCSDRV